MEMLSISVWKDCSDNLAGFHLRLYIPTMEHQFMTTGVMYIESIHIVHKGMS